jgi:hypothetical protein
VAANFNFSEWSARAFVGTKDVDLLLAKHPGEEA